VKKPVTHTYVIRPEIPYVGIHSLLVRDGWSGGPVTLTPPLVRDEPEAARFRRGRQVASYALDPVIWLRLLRSTRPPPADLPLLSATEILGLLDLPGSDTESLEGLLLGVVAAGECGLEKAVPRLLRLRSRPASPIVAAAAASSIDRISRGGQTRRRR
jgi:hypothetical protein